MYLVRFHYIVKMRLDKNDEVFGIICIPLFVSKRQYEFRIDFFLFNPPLASTLSK